MGAMYLPYDGARVSTESALGKELLKWERPSGYDPAKNPYPRMLYRAQHLQGRRSVGEVLDSLFGGVAGAAEQWTSRCQMTVHDESEHHKAMEQGWRNSPQEALDYLEARDNARSNETAARHAADARMSDKAQREADAVDHTTLKQIPSIPEKRGLSPEAKQARRDSLAKARAAKVAKKQAAEPVPA